MKRLTLVSILCVFSCIDLFAQKHEPELPSWSLITNPMSWAESDAGLTLGVNYRWSRRFSATFEPTWIFFTLVMRDDIGTINHPSGYRFRSDFRMHFPKRGRKFKENFLAIGLHYKHVNYERLETFGINCGNGDCDYYQQAYYKEIKNEIGGLLKWGVTTALSQNQRWLIEFYGGFGIKYVTFKQGDLPTGASFVNPPTRMFPNIRFADNASDQFIYPMIPMGTRIVFKLH